MAINQTCLESEIQTAVDNLTTSCSAEVFLETAIAADNANTNRKFSVALGCQLPDLETANIPPGTMVYVEELGVPVVSTLQAWKGLDGRTYRKDVPDTRLYAWGRNCFCMIGINCSNNSACILSPVQEFFSSITWSSMTAGPQHSIGTKIDGTLWAGGRNGSGQLGDGAINFGSISVFKQEYTLSETWTKGEAGNVLSYGLKSDGTLWGWGNGGDGNLATNNNLINYSSPVQEITSSSNWCDIAVVESFQGAMAIKTDGTLWGWGRNIDGHMSVGDRVAYSSPVQEMCSDTTWSQVVGGWCRTHAIKTNGTLWSAGNGNCGGLGTGTLSHLCSYVQEISSSTNWCQVTAGLNHASAIKNNGTLWAWGLNCVGQLGTNNITCYSSPVQEITSSTDWCLISQKCSTSIGVKTNGTLWAWGYNLEGSIGDGTLINKSSPVQEFSSTTTWSYVKSGWYNSFGITCTT